jgi:hypothetical protein
MSSPSPPAGCSWRRPEATSRLGDVLGELREEFDLRIIGAGDNADVALDPPIERAHADTAAGLVLAEQVVEARLERRDLILRLEPRDQIRVPA